MDDEQEAALRAKLLAQRAPSESATVDEVQAMSVEALRELFDLGGFPVTVSWDDLMALRSPK